MKKTLFKQAFEKAEKASGKTTIHGLSKYLSEAITENFGCSVSEKTLVRYYKKYIENEDEDVSHTPNTDILNAISGYLGYENFEDFVAKNSEVSFVTVESGEEKHTKRVTAIKRRNVVIIIVAALIIIIFILVISANRQRWMVWNGEEYIEVSFDVEKYSLSQLKLYNEERITGLRKITPDCNTEFFTEDGMEKIWYGKSPKGELEYFTYFGKHPETGKTLKKITRYMINKHICKK